MMPSGAKKMLLVSGRAYPELADEVAACLGIKPTPTKLFDFANGEIFVRFLDSVRGCDVFVLQSHTSPINEWIMEQLIMVDALKRASARRITVVTPFFGYARQDKKNRGREPISARLMADLFATAGADRLMAVDLHTAQIQGFFDGPVDHLFALPILASYIEKKLDVSQVTVVAPDAGRVRVCERWTDRLGCPLAIIHKRRDPDVANQVRMFEVVGQVAGRTCILVDDMIDTGATIAKAAEALFEQGADRVIATATHGVLSGAAVDILKNSQDQRDHHHEHAAGAAGEAVRQAHRAVDRAAAGPGDQRGVQRRLGHQPVRRPELRSRDGQASGGRRPSSPPPPEARGRRPCQRLRAVLAARPAPPPPLPGTRTASRRAHPARRAGVQGAGRTTPPLPSGATCSPVGSIADAIGTSWGRWFTPRLSRG